MPSCLHYVFKGTILCRCGKHIRPDLDMMRRIKAAFEVLKAPCFRTSAINARGYKHALIYGRNTTTKQKTHYVVVRKRHKTVYVDLGPMAKMTRPTGSPSWSMSGQMLGWDTWTILQKSTSPIQRRTYKGKDTTIYFTCGVSTKISKRHLYHKDQDTKMQRKHLVDMHKQVRQDCGVPLSQKLKGNACEISSILQCKGILSG